MRSPLWWSGHDLFGGRGGIGDTIVGLFVLGVLNDGLDYVKIDSS